MITRVAMEAERRRLWQPGDRVGIAVSGGFDSVALLEILTELAPRWSLRLAVVHANHCLRGAESDGDEAFVRELARERGLDVIAERLEPPADRSSLEERLRRLRYDFFARARQTHALDRIATAHTLEDQAETVFLHLIRGSGISGLAGIPPSNEAGIVRPLLGVTRAELWEHLKDSGIHWREDSSNRDPRIARNRFRAGMLPALRIWNPRAMEALARTAEVAREEEHYWNAEVDRHFRGTWEPHRLGLVAGREALARLPLALRRRLVREAIAQVKGNTRGVGFDHVEEVLALTAGAAGSGGVSLPGVEAERSFDSILIRRSDREIELRARPAPVGVPIEIPGGILEVRTSEWGYTEGDVVLDGSLAGKPLVLRGWKPGDAYRPAGHSRRRKLKDLFQMARVPSWDRHTWPIITREEQIVWTRRFGAAAEWAAREGAREAVLIFERVSPQSGTLTARPSV